MSTKIETCAYGGWARNLRISDGTSEAIVTLDVGPRIIRFGRIGKVNVLGEIAEQMGGTGEPKWLIRGGHRLWVAPEDPTRTYVTDNAPIAHTANGGVARVSHGPDPQFALERTIELAFRDGDLLLTHRIRNHGGVPVELAPWAITVLATGGIAVVPFPPRGKHPGDSARSAADFAPNQTVSLWPYFSFADPRLSLGRSALRLRQDPAATEATKIGFAHRGEWVAYWTAGTTFVKRFQHVEGARYPDGGVNFETYTDANILELESMGPLVTVGVGEETSHTEVWSLVDDLPRPDSDEIVESAFFPRISRK